ncbi:polyprenyl diphosphate synthase [Pajaroellobacter abortibovis]|uniref:Isoprenyl transferase n=1 Tax=Pajaroellobacter abortibovis TaxID=1882918 RepID=A0A1L6MXX8_9BACT|nr:polyprenyl diphosphate synthase [Pajaroellobacter abortibovis]APS00461.1 di-trans,poly-cis-decaprenylcistransferase [Pajaroellobacter abortibovis]
MLFEGHSVPSHVGIIMDGNGRWAQLHGLPRIRGHHEGAKAVRKVVRAARRIGVRILTLYAFSEQNWARPLGEIEILMRLLHDFLISEREELLQNGIRLHAIGNLSRLPADVRSVLEPLCRESAGNQEMLLTLALSYGGREEIVSAAKSIVHAVMEGKMRVEDINTEVFQKHVPSLMMGDPDLIIRTSGEYRISNFLLYGLAYAELYFADVLWPDFSEDDFYAAIRSFQSRERRFGVAGHAEPPAGEGQERTIAPKHIAS